MNIYQTLWLEIISTQERVSWRAQLMETLFLVIFLCKNTKEDYIGLLQKMKKKCLHWCSLFNENVIVVKLKLNLSWFGVEFDVWWFIRAMYVFYPCMVLWQDIFRIEMKRCMPNLLLKQNSIQYLWCAEPFSDNPLI